MTKKKFLTGLTNRQTINTITVVINLVEREINIRKLLYLKMTKSQNKVIKVINKFNIY